MAELRVDLRLTRFGEEGWRATFFPAGRAHSVVAGSGWAATPWRTVQEAAWETLARDTDEPGPGRRASNP